MSKDYALKGNIIYSNTDRQLLCAPNSYLIVNNNLCVDVYPCLPEKYQHLQVTDYQQAIIIPGFTDLHLHAPQYANIGLGMDLELLQWLEQLTFREEAKFADLHYADQAYQLFCHDLDQSATTRACIFGTIHRAATEILMEKLQGIGIKAYVGKVNMDSNCPHNLRESSPEQSARDTEAWVTANESKFTNIRPILTPRFVPSCSPQLLTLLGELQRQYCLPLQSHLSENLSEVAWVKELYPQAASYADVYRHFGLLGDTVPTIMAHCVYLQQSEKQLLQERNVFIAHCPTSNTNLSSGAAPVGEYLERHIPLGLGSDVSGGHTLSMMSIISQAIAASKLRWRLEDQSCKPLTVEDGFYLATLGGGAFFGQVGSFLPGYQMDAIVLDDQRLRSVDPLSLKERLEKLVFLSDDREIIAKYVAGRKLWDKTPLIAR